MVSLRILALDLTSSFLTPNDFTSFFAESIDLERKEKKKESVSIYS